MTWRASGPLFEWRDGARGRCRGTAFSISPTHALTAAHCIGDRATGLVSGGTFELALRDAEPVVVAVVRYDFALDAALLQIVSNASFAHHMKVFRHHMKVFRSETRCATWSAPAHPIGHGEGIRLTGSIADLDGRVKGARAIQLTCDQGGHGFLEGSSGAAVCWGEWVLGLIRWAPPAFRQHVIFAAPIVEIIKRLELEAVLPPPPLRLLLEGVRRASAGPHAKVPSWLEPLQRLIDLETRLSDSEREALYARGAAIDGRGPLIDALREIAARIGGPPVTQAEPGAKRSIEALLAACTARFEISRGVIRAVVVSHDRSTAEICRRAVALDLEVLLERHRVILSEAAIPIIRAPTTIELEDRARLSVEDLAVLDGHAKAAADQLPILQYRHLGEHQTIAAADLVPVPGATTVGELIIPLVSRRACRLTLRIAAGSSQTVEIPRGHPDQAIVPLPEAAVGAAVDWKVVEDDALGRPHQVAAGWARIGTAGLERLGDVEARDRLRVLVERGMWNEIVLDAWPRFVDGAASPDDLMVLVQVLRSGHAWLQCHASGWMRLDVYGQAVGLVQERLHNSRERTES